MLSRLEKRARGEKRISNSRSLVKVVRVRKLPFFFFFLFYDPHSDFVQRGKKNKGILDPLLKPLWLCTHMKQGGGAGGEKAKKGIAPKLNCKHRFYAG